ncbi:MAG: TonB-dependent receptor [Verrucomicrobia bacterium]|nr:TonB-dependent receptor [Verrucomicrobiota bacterium]
MSNTSYYESLKAGVALRRAIIGGMSLQLAAVAAFGQGAAEPTEQLKPVVVTGSNIPTAETVGVAPVDVVSIEDIERKGAKTIEQYIKTMPTAVGGGNYGVSRGNGGDGTAAIALRGIPGGTLVLINGRRTAPNGRIDNGSNVDLNAIPLAAIERIEILKDGGSAIYGADAIAGVVNLILRKDFNGTEIDASYGNTTSKDAGEQRYSFITGMAKEGTSVLVGGSFYKANALYSVDRDRSRPDLTDPNNTSGTSNPGRIRTTTPGASSIPSGGLVYRGAPGTTGTATNQYSAFNASTDRFPFPLYTPAIRPSERYSIFGNAEHELFGENLKFFSEAFYTHTFSYNQFAPTPIVFQNLTTASSPNGIVIPANNPYNVFGVPVDRMLYRVVEIGPRTETVTANVFRFVSGLKGRIAETDWNWEAAVLYAQDERDEKLGGELSRASLEAAVQDTNPATAFNVFGNQANSAAALSRVGQQLLTLGQTTLFSVDGKVVNSELFSLPAGPVAAALGGEHREERGETIKDGATTRGDTVGFNSGQGFIGSRDVQSFFAELNIPVFGSGLNYPGLYSFEVTGAFRYDNYSDFGDTWNPKVGVRWQPVDQSLTLRGSYSESFKAPTFDDLYTPLQENFPELRNPVTGVFEQIREFQTGNSLLLPETAINYSAGVVYTPPMVKGLSLGADWFRIEQEDVAGSADQFILDRNFATGGPTTPTAQFANFVVWDPATQTYTTLRAPTLNLSRRIIEGVDLNGSYVLPTQTAGTFTFSALAAYYYRYEQEDIPGSGLRDRLGDFVDPSQGFGLGSLPRFKGVFSAFWGYQNLEAGWTANYISSYRDDVAAGFDRQVDDWLTFDLQASYQLPYQTKITVGVLNIADEDPPLVNGAFADKYDRDTHELRGRFVYASLNKKF